MGFISLTGELHHENELVTTFPQPFHKKTILAGTDS
jgi:hypothetical protein